MMMVLPALSFRNKQFHLQPDQLIAGVAKNPLSLRIDLNNNPCLIDGNNRIGNRIQEA